MHQKPTARTSKTQDIPVQSSAIIDQTMSENATSFTMSSGFVDYYALLGVPKTATREEILAKSEVQRAALSRTHKKVPVSELAMAKFSAALVPYLEAKTLLLDSTARAAYDEVYEEHICEERAAEDAEEASPSQSVDVTKVDRVAEHQPKQVESKLARIYTFALFCWLVSELSAFATLYPAFGLEKTIPIFPVYCQTAMVLLVYLLKSRWD
jgi:hypothetical protein